MADLDLPDGFSMTAPGTAPLTPPDGFAAQPAYTSSILPFSYDSTGKRTFDPFNAGITGAISDAIRLPGDVASGTQPVIGPNGQTDPGLASRAFNFVAAMTPNEFSSRVPSASALKNAATAGYDAFRNSGLEFHGPAVGDMIQGVKQGLESDGIIAEHAPKTFAALNKAIGDVAGVAGDPDAQSIATAANMQAIRRSLTKVSGENTDIEAARRAKQGVDAFLTGFPDGAILSEPAGGAAKAARTFANANANYAAAQRSNAITGSLDKANTGILEQADARAAASHSGQNLDNSIRQRVASYLQNPENVAGLTQPEIDALNDVVKGSWLQNRARWVGNTLGGGGGLGHLAAGMAGIAGAHALGAEGAGLGLALPGTGLLAKSLENSMARSALNPVDEMMRMRSPLYDATQPNLPPLTRSGVVTRAILPGLLAPQQQQQQQPTGLLGPWLWS